MKLGKGGIRLACVHIGINPSTDFVSSNPECVMEKFKVPRIFTKKWAYEKIFVKPLSHKHQSYEKYF